jgi:hypothetical protein
MGHATLLRGGDNFQKRSIRLVKGAKWPAVKSPKTVYPEDVSAREPSALSALSALPQLQEETKRWRDLSGEKGGEKGGKQGGGGGEQGEGGKLVVNMSSEADASSASAGLVKQLLAEQKRLVAEQARTNELLARLLKAPSVTQSSAGAGAAFST